MLWISRRLVFICHKRLDRTIWGGGGGGGGGGEGRGGGEKEGEGKGAKGGAGSYIPPNHPLAKKKKKKNPKLLEAVSADAYGGVDLFEGVTPAPAPAAPTTGDPLGDADPRDPGIDISGIMAVGGKNGRLYRAGTNYLT